MGFQQNQASTKTEYDLDDSVDREIIRYFERELEQYENRDPIIVLENTIFERKLQGFELYLHENNLLRYSKEYPCGAVVRSNLSLYNETMMKRRALQILRDRRKFREEQDSVKGKALAEQAVELLEGKMVVNGK
jgi:hypothetical protein